MKLSEIESEIEKMGFLTQIHNSINSLTLSKADSEQNPILGTTSRIEQRDDKMFYIYYLAQIPIEKEFFKIDELKILLNDVYTKKIKR